MIWGIMWKHVCNTKSYAYDFAGRLLGCLNKFWYTDNYFEIIVWVNLQC